MIYYIKFFYALFTCFLLMGFSAAAQAAEKMIIAERGHAFATIVVDGSSARLKSAAETMSHYLQRSSGATFPVAYQPGTKITTPIQIRILSKSTYKSGDLTISDQFAIEFPDTKTILIAGESDWGAEIGVYDFLERFAGVRWLFPGELGEHVPRNYILRIPVKKVYASPGYVIRIASGFEGKEEMQWAYRNRMHDVGISFHHNLHKLFPPGKYAKSHPEFFPIIKGKRYIPADNVKGGWQPCFSAPGLAEEATKNIIEYFKNNSNVSSFSLGVNDSAGYCECEKCKARVAGKMNSIGKPNYSELYYSWVNAVVTAVLTKYPDKWFGCLAYDYVQDPPINFSLNSRIVPFITYDRMKWIDSAEEQEGKYLTGLWHKKASILGWYDYIYGKQYLVPRIYTNKISEYLKYGSSNGVQAVYAEAYPNWGEGPKLYLYLRLLWDPNIDLNTTLNDWYISAVGATAAPSLAAYFDYWESCWTKRIVHSSWFKSVASMYLPFYRTDYVNEVTENDLDFCRTKLEDVINKAETLDQKKRAEYFMQTFKNYEKGIKKATKKSSMPKLLDTILNKINAFVY